MCNLSIYFICVYVQSINISYLWICAIYQFHISVYVQSINIFYLWICAIFQYILSRTFTICQYSIYGNVKSINILFVVICTLSVFYIYLICGNVSSISISYLCICAICQYPVCGYVQSIFIFHLRICAIYLYPFWGNVQSISILSYLWKCAIYQYILSMDLLKVVSRLTGRIYFWAQFLKVIILDGNSEIGALVRSNLFNLICLRHLLRPRAVTNWSLSPKWKWCRPYFLMQIH